MNVRQAELLMNDPHVEMLVYELRERDDVSYRDPPPIEVDAEDFEVELREGRLELRMKTHCASAEEAKSLVEPFLKGWEIDSALEEGREAISFKFQNARVVDRNPAEGQRTLHQELRDGVAVGDEVSVHITRKRYPTAPRHFLATPDVRTLWRRYQGAREGKEPLLSMAYFNLTVIEAMAGGRKEAANVFKIHADVLSRIGELTSVRGDRSTARKMPRDGTVHPLTDAEERWLYSAIRALILHVGEVESGGEPAILTMEDLPST